MWWPPIIMIIYSWTKKIRRERWRSLAGWANNFFAFVPDLLVNSFMRKLLFLVALCGSQLLFAHRTIVYCGKLIDPKSWQVLTEMSIIGQGNKIVDLQKGYQPAAQGDKLIDLKGLT